MEYKVGDKVIIYTWNELVSMYDTNKFGDISLNNIFYWTKNNDSFLPPNRIVTIENVGTQFVSIKLSVIMYINPELIKCHANEYYLQEIKDELQKG